MCGCVPFSQWCCGKKKQRGTLKFEIECLIIEYIDYWLYYVIAILIVYNVEPTAN